MSEIVYINWLQLIEDCQFKKLSVIYVVVINMGKILILWFRKDKMIYLEWVVYIPDALI